MKKKMACLMMVGILTLGFSTVAFANQSFRGCCAGGARGTMWNDSRTSSNGFRGMMWDDNGDFLTRDAFSERLDDLIADGFITADSEDFYLDMYDFCGTYGGGSTGFRNGCVVSVDGRWR